MEAIKNIPEHLAIAFAHEIRNPLTNINLSLDVLQGNLNGNDAAMLYTIIRNNCRIINEHVSTLLLSFADTPVELVKCDINLVLDEVLEMAKDRITLRHITVKKNYTKDLCEIAIDKSKIKIALLNIIINAIEAMPAEKGELKLITKLIDGKCTVSIEDNGKGISKEMVDKIFKPFFSNKPGGLGLGLATTHDILTSHKATVDIVSLENAYTRFIISFNLN